MLNGTFLVHSNDKLFYMFTKRSPTYHSLHPESLASLQDGLRGWHRRLRGHLRSAAGPRIRPRMAHTHMEPCMASRTSLDANVTHHGDQYHHNMVAGVECPCLGVEACIRGVVHPLRMHHRVFPERPGTSVMEQAEPCPLAPNPFSDSAYLHRWHLRVGLRSYLVFGPSADDEPTGCQ